MNACGCDGEYVCPEGARTWAEVRRRYDIAQRDRTAEAWEGYDVARAKHDEHKKVPEVIGKGKSLRFGY